jgi:hypothetical protein
MNVTSDAFIIIRRCSKYDLKRVLHIIYLLFYWLLSVFCFSACSTSFSVTDIPLRFRTRSIYFFAKFSLSYFSPKSSNSSSVVGTQNGSRSSATNPLKISWGLAAPEVFFRRSKVNYNSPSANPKLSITGMLALIVKYEVPSFISSDNIFPLRLFSTA